MKQQSETLYIHTNGHLLGKLHTQNIIAVEVAEFGHFPSIRGARRKEQSIAVRGLLNRLLASIFPASEKNADDLEKTVDGKPYFSGKGAPSISLSHSGDWAACTVSDTICVGIDVEVIQTRDWSAFGQDVFHTAEKPWVFSAKNKEQDIRALTCWCRKEAIVKAAGLGLATPFSDIYLSPQGDLIACPERLGSPNGWKTYTTSLYGKIVLSVAWKN